ncbi:MAG: hypothetical protein BGN92_08020 [Sphingobacteriales bacterium 41-5]|nr:MAG: hypothetical protein BGN92_08020 [Sphingobacteriales bacterium 41-5]
MKHATSTQALTGLEMVKKLAEEIRICAFCTNLGEQPFAARPMIIQEVDDNGDIWFLSSEVSDKNIEVKMDDKVQLLFCDIRSSQYLSVYGSAYIYKEKKIIDAKSKHSVKAWIPEGTNDPNIALIRIIPEDAFYWNAETRANVHLLKKIR